MGKHPLICLVGVDAVGKTSVASCLARLIGANILKTPSAAFEGTRKLAELSKPTVRYLYYLSSVRLSLLDVDKKLEASPIILDRSVQCTCCFHAAMGVEIIQSQIKELEFPEPDFTILLTVDPEEALRRIKKRLEEEDRPDKKIELDRALQARVLSNYRNLKQFGFEGGFLPIEFPTDGKTPDEVAREIHEFIKKNL